VILKWKGPLFLFFSSGREGGRSREEDDMVVERGRREGALLPWRSRRGLETAAVGRGGGYYLFLFSQIMKSCS